MKTISLKQLKEKYFPEVTKQKFAEILGFDNSLISKILNGKYDSVSGTRWRELSEHIKNIYGYQLISDNKFVIEGEKAKKIVQSLQYEIKIRDEKIADLVSTVEELLGAIRIMSDCKETCSRASAKLEMYKKGGK